MLVLLAAPVILAVAVIHSALQRHAPSNILVRRAWRSEPSGRVVLAHAILALGFSFAVHVVLIVIDSGASRSLFLVVMLLAWDSVKFAVSTSVLLLRLLATLCLRGVHSLRSRRRRAAVAASERERPARLGELAPIAAPQR